MIQNNDRKIADSLLFYEFQMRILKSQLRIVVNCLILHLLYSYGTL